MILGNFDGNVLWSWGKKSLRRPVDYRKTTCLNRSLAGWQVLFTDGPLLCFRFGHFPDPLRFFQFIEHIRVFTTHIYSQLSTTNFNLIQWDANRHLACVHLICTIYRIFNHKSVYYIYLHVYFQIFQYFVHAFTLFPDINSTSNAKEDGSRDILEMRHLAAGTLQHKRSELWGDTYWDTPVIAILFVKTDARNTFR